MRFTQSEKYEIIQIVEGSTIGVNKTLIEHRIWNKIPNEEKNEVVQLALEKPELSSRELACYITDNYKRFISESSVYRILKQGGLITAPAFMLRSASDSFKDKTVRVNQMWQTDFTYFKIIGWGWYYLSTVLNSIYSGIPRKTHRMKPA